MSVDNSIDVGPLLMEAEQAGVVITVRGDGISITGDQSLGVCARIRENAKLVRAFLRGEIDEGGWAEPRPLPPALSVVKDFNQDLLPECFRRFVVDVAERMQCPIDFPAVAVVTVFASIIGRQCGIRPKRQDDWTVIPNLWALIVGRPGVMKSPAIDSALNIVRALEVQASKAYAEEMKSYEIRQEIAKQKKKLRESKLRDAVRRGTSDTEIVEMFSDEEDFCRPARRRYLINDTTIEKFGEILETSPNGQLLERDEIYGWLRSLDKEGHESDRGFFLQAWNGTGRYTYDRIMRGETVIPATIVSIIGTIQPGRLQKYVRGAVEGGSGDDGLLQRFQLAVWPDCSKAWANVDRWPDTDAKKTLGKLAKELANLNCEGVMADKHGNDVPYLRFTIDAQELFDQWRHGLEFRLRSDELSPAMESHLSKYRSLVPSLALIFHLVEWGAGDIGRAALVRALHWADYLESHANRIYGASQTASAVASLADKLSSKQLQSGFTVRDVYKGKGWSGLTDRHVVLEAVSELEELNWLRRLPKEPTVGKPTNRYEINPRIFETAQG